MLQDKSSSVTVALDTKMVWAFQASTIGDGVGALKVSTGEASAEITFHVRYCVEGLGSSVFTEHSGSTDLRTQA